MVSSTMDEETALKAITEAETNLMKVNKSSISELMSLRQPAPSILSLFEALIVVFAPSKRMLDWNYAKKWLNGNTTRLMTTLKSFNKDKLTDEQVTRLQAILDREECEPERVRKCSPACYEVCLWLRALVQYSTAQRKFQKTA